MSPVWHDAYVLRMALRCLCIADAGRCRAARRALRRSRRMRRRVIDQCRINAEVALLLRLQGAKP